MSDNLFHKDPINNPNNENDPQQQPLQGVNFRIHTYAGEVISNESYEVLQELLYDGADFVDAAKVIARDLSILRDLGADLQIEDGLVKTGEVLKISPFDSLESREDFVKRTCQRIHAVLAQAEDSIREDVGPEIDISDLVSGSANVLAIFANLKYKLSFFIEEDVEHQTDLAAAMYTMGKTQRDLGKIITDVTGEGDILRIEDEQITELSKELTFPEEDQKYYTSLSPHLLHSLISKLDELRATFIDEVQSAYIDKDQIISILKNYEDSALTAATEQEYIKMTHCGYDITITWSNPALSSVAVLNNQAKLGEVTAPIKKLLQELGGDLSYSVDRYEIKMTISCPKTEGYDEDICQGIPNDLIFTMCEGCARILPYEVLLKLAIGYDPADKSKTFFFTTEKDCLSDPLTRESMVKILSHCDTFNTNSSLYNVVVVKSGGDESVTHIIYSSDSINGLPSSGDKAELAITTSFLTNQSVVSELFKMLQTNKSQVLYLSTNKLDELKEIIAAIQSAISQAQKLTDKQLTFNLHSIDKKRRIFQITDSDGNLIINGAYNFELKHFVGRCHSVELTHKVLRIFDEIAGFNGVEATKLEELNKGGQLVTNFINELKKHGVEPSERFTTLMTHLVTSLTINLEITPLQRLLNSREITKQVPLNKFYNDIRSRVEFDVVCLDDSHQTIALDTLNILNFDDPFYAYNHVIE